ncbi:hypothetical protein J2X66_005518 [Pseudomonas sp. 3296]|uniref:hypothetical protein n=1 Tax=Pseudomonas sp. 3296 TaxID=2817753 RepID=UPI0028595A3D|nr:hypothetical protein [Pseudomonas sp. 3296]MDR6918615.1 hypothetical protein [Pseudomonas sp. 3296]
MKAEHLAVSFAVALVLLAVYSLVGHIPVGNGGGWDGSIYLDYIEKIGRGEAVMGDPYRLIRLSGFLPLILASTSGVSREALISIQCFLNIAMLSLAAALFFDALRVLGVARNAALLSIVTLVSSWSFSTLPVFYPVLSDGVVLAASCFCLWSWARSYRWVIYSVLLFSLWLIPGFFLIPLVLAIWPREKQCSPLEELKYKWVFASLVFATMTIGFLYFIVPVAFALSPEEIATHSASPDGQTAIIDLYGFSMACFIVSGLVVCGVFSHLAVNISMWKSISASGIVLAVASLCISGGLMYGVVDWNNGFTGPPLWKYMLLQTLAAPLKPLVAHFLTFGPVMLLAMLSSVSLAFDSKSTMSKALLVLMVGFLPLLAFGSESRQWIGILPIAVAVFSVAGYSMAVRIWSAVFSVLLMLPVFWLKAATLSAVSLGLGFQSLQWQLYFGRFGPWMSADTYRLGVGLMVVFFIVTLALNWRASVSTKLGLLLKKAP